ncbi:MULTISPECIES: hypothetical protein [unclassified Nostoc]|uniref:hypothetical protein n=1 Tax=unclassified Nostoc TaxID=2593658 RepID=UPI0013D6A74E|nr:MULTISPECIES: hypothetical protein [unclassified Nostoc]NEU77720.1 hypothetical protein [Nostoc sp. UIC 10630]
MGKGQFKPFPFPLSPKTRKVLTQLGLSTESWRSLEDDRRVRYYRLNTEDVTFVQPVLPMISESLV